MIRELRERAAAALRALADLVDWPYAEGTDWHPLTGGPEPADWAGQAPCASVEESSWTTFSEWFGERGEIQAPRPYVCSRPIGHPGPWHAASDGETIIAAWTGQVEL